MSPLARTERDDAHMGRGRHLPPAEVSRMEELQAIIPGALLAGFDLIGRHG